MTRRRKESALKHRLADLLDVVPLALLFSGLLYWRARQLVLPEGPGAAESLVVVGIVGSALSGLYAWLAGRWPSAAANLVLWIACTIGMGIGIEMVPASFAIFGVPVSLLGFLIADF